MTIQDCQSLHAVYANVRFFCRENDVCFLSCDMMPSSSIYTLSCLLTARCTMQRPTGSDLNFFDIHVVMFHDRHFKPRQSVKGSDLNSFQLHVDILHDRPIKTKGLPLIQISISFICMLSCCMTVMPYHTRVLRAQISVAYIVDIIDNGASNIGSTAGTSLCIRQCTNIIVTC